MTRASRRSDSARAAPSDPHFGAGRRFAPRVPVQADCAVVWGTSSIEGTLVNLSTGGAAVALLADSTLAAGAAVSLELPAARGLVTVPATTVSQDAEAFGAFLLRLKFDECGDDLRAIVEELATEFRKRQASIFRGRV